MESLLKSLIEPLVEDIKEIKIEKQTDNQNVKFTVHVPQKDIAKVIGKQGKMVKSIKNLVKIRSIKEGVFATVEVVES